MKQQFGNTYTGTNPTHGVYTENNLRIWKNTAVAISHHWSKQTADEAAKKETASRGESCVVVEYETN